MTITLSEDDAPKRRDKLVIISEIIDIAKAGNSKTSIMLKANLSFTQLNQYLSILTETSLLEKKELEGREIYQATPKGLDFLQKQREIIAVLNNKISRNYVKTRFKVSTLYISKGPIINTRD